jgi:hypothetical protein
MVTVKLLVAPKQAAAADTTQYTAPAGTKAIIDKFTITNTTAAVQSISVNLPSTGVAVGDDNLVLDSKVLAAGETYTCPELVGQVLEAGGFISTIASLAASITIRVSGREIV